MKKQSTATYTLLLVIGILILANVLAYKIFIRLDLTEDKQYSLSEASKDILKNLEEPVTVKAYFSEELSPDLAKIRNDFKSLLAEYERRSKGMVIFEFLNPNEDEKIEQEAIQNHVMEQVNTVIRKDKASQQKVFLGATVQIGERKSYIPAIVRIDRGRLIAESSMEYLLTTSIKKISVIDKPFIGILQGNGEAELQSMPQALQELSILYNIEPISFSDTVPTDLNRYKTLALIAPSDTLTAFQLQQLDDFLAQGGNMFIAFNRVTAELSQQMQMGTGVFCGIAPWLREKGIEVAQNFVLDVNCGAIRVVENRGAFNIQSNKDFPYSPIIKTFTKHPISKGLEQVLFDYTSSISFSGDSAIKFQPLLKSSKLSATKPVPTYIDITKQWTEADFPLSNLVVAAAFSGPIVPGQSSKMVVVSNGSFAINGIGQQAHPVLPDNVSLFTNSIDWLSDDTGLIELRTKGISTRPIEELSDGKRLRLKLINLILPVLLIVSIGILVLRINKKKRQKRMEVGHV